MHIFEYVYISHIYNIYIYCLGYLQCLPVTEESFFPRRPAWCCPRGSPAGGVPEGSLAMPSMRFCERT